MHGDRFTKALLELKSALIELGEQGCDFEFNESADVVDGKLTGTTRYSLVIVDDRAKAP